MRELKNVDCPVFVMHGTDDEEIPFFHGKMLHEAAKQPHPPFWVQGAGHNNVAEHAADEYYARLNGFVESLENESRS